MSISSYLCMFLVVGLVFVLTNGDEDRKPVKAWRKKIDIENDIDRLTNLYNQHVCNNNTDALLEMYHPRATYLSGSYGPVNGPENIRPLLGWIDQVHRVESITTKFELLEVTYAVKLLDINEYNTADELVYHGKCAQIWKETQDGWKLYYDVYYSI